MTEENPNEAMTTQSIPARDKGEGGLQSGGEEVKVEARKGREGWRERRNMERRKNPRVCKRKGKERAT